MEVARTDYDQAVRLTKEGMMRGEISPYEANLFLARITYNYTSDYGVAAGYMRKALDLEESKDPATRATLLYRLASILRNERDYSALFSACSEGKEAAYLAEMPFLVHSFDFVAGSCLFSIGEDEKGFDMMREALSAASKLAKSEEDYGHLLYFSGSLINSYLEVKDFPSVLQESERYENWLKRMQELTPPASEEYIDRCRFYLNMNRARCYIDTGDRAAAQAAFETAGTCAFANTDNGKERIVGYYAAVGEPDRILAIYRDDIPFQEADTVSFLYRVRIARLREAYANAGMDGKAREYEARYDALSRQLEEKSEGILVNAARYDAQSSRLQLSHAMLTFYTHRRRMIAVVIILLLVSALLIVIIIRVNRERDLRRQKEAESLEKGIRSLQRQVSIIAERGMRKDFRSDGTAAPSLSKLIEDNQLYLNKNLNRESAASLLGVSQKEISAMLAEMEPGLSFPDYIKGLRIRHALKLMGENPEIPIGELADRCGFYTIRTLQRSFLSITGKTPSEYARGLKK